jgi:hypothetical protein
MCGVHVLPRPITRHPLFKPGLFIMDFCYASGGLKVSFSPRFCPHCRVQFLVDHAPGRTHLCPRWHRSGGCGGEARHGGVLFFPVRLLSLHLLIHIHHHGLQLQTHGVVVCRNFADLPEANPVASCLKNTQEDTAETSFLFMTSHAGNLSPPVTRGDSLWFHVHSGSSSGRPKITPVLRVH